MIDRRVKVYLDLNGVTYPIGILWSHFHKDRETSEFEYIADWLKNPSAFALAPSLCLVAGKQQPARKIPLIGAFGDSTPDSWGRILMRRYEAQLAKSEHRNPRTLNEIDYLLYVADEVRQGALRFKTDDSDEFQYPSRLKAIPPMINLRELLAASEKVTSDLADEEDLKLLLAPGSSLGGARPKASVVDQAGNLCIAKFPKQGDLTNNVMWEAVALTLAKQCGLNTQEWSLAHVQTKNVLIVKRFDRKTMVAGCRQRIPFLSAMSMLDAVDNDAETHSYLDLADAIRQFGAEPKKDLAELWKRVVFSILISNTDDHLRNHGFLYDSDKGWRLSPLYDVNPSSDNKGVLSTYLTETDNTQSLELALEIGQYFAISPKEAQQIVVEMKRAVASNWQPTAKRFKIPKNEIDQMACAFTLSG